MNATIERHEIQAGSATLSYLKSGSGPALLMMHGLMANALDFKMQFEEFSSRRLCLAPDLPGFGMSREGCSETPGLYVAADAMETFIRELVPEGEKLDLLGHSFGSVVALELSSRIPEKLRSVTIVGAPTDMTAKPLQRARRKTD
jgi:pimeloyl-ACP methyl ester carboxylesterase